MIQFEKYYKSLAQSAPEETLRSAAEYYENMKSSTAWSHGYLVHTLYIPKIFSEEEHAYLSRMMRIMYDILVKVTRHYIEDAEYRRFFAFDKRLEELIVRPLPYSCEIPIARLDFFFNEKERTFKFCEFNTDGSSAMNEDREMNRCLAETDTFRRFAQRYEVRTNEFFDSWAKEFLKIYGECKNPVKNPHIGIVDFCGGERNNEFEEFKRVFNRNACTCEIYDITELEYDGIALRGFDGKKIDAIYRRAVTCDIMKNYAEVMPFIDAVKDNAVCLIGDFRTQIVHNKRIFKILHDEATLKFLLPDEREYIKEHIPFTALLTPESIRDYDVVCKKDSWVIKPEDSYASKGVHAGIEFDDENKWAQIVSDCGDKAYLLQEYCPPHESINIDLLYDKNAVYRPFSNITGMFMYGGQPVGEYSRIAKTGIISTQYNEMSLPTVIAALKE